jgi:hypothetical protein
MNMLVIQALFLVTPVLLTHLAAAHTLEEIRAMLHNPSQALLDATARYESLKGEIGGSRAHILQHKLLDDSLRSQHEQLCMEFHQKLSALDRKIEKLKTEGKAAELEESLQLRDRVDARIKVSCNFIN